MTADITASPSGAAPRAFVLLKSRRRLDLLNPDPHAWTDDDLAAGLSRTMRWGGASRWEYPLSVAQHRLTVLTIREADGALTPGEALRELLHDATEFMLGWDCITPLKEQLGEPFRALEARLQSAIDTRYRLPEWTPEAYAIHKRADRLAAASEAFHVAGWSRVDIRKTLRIAEVPLLDDPLSPCGFAPWEPWPPRDARGCSSNGSMRSNASINPHCESLSQPLSLSHSRWSRTSCRILMMTPHSTLTQTETPQLTTNGRRSPANRLGRRLSIRNAISPMVALLSTRSHRANQNPDQGCFSPWIDPRVGGGWHRQNVDPDRSWYIAHFGRPDATYGSLGAAIGLMTWMWISMIAILLGAKLNAEIQRMANSASSTA